MSVIMTYILDIAKKYKPTEFDIGDQTIDILSEFADKHYQSTYMIYSRSKRIGSKIDYKNTRKRVKRLESLGYIEPVNAEEVKEEDATHGAKYYRISETGMFQLFLQHDIDFTLFDMLQVNGDYSIFNALLYPIFNKETFRALNSIDRTQISREDIFEHTATAKKFIILTIYHYLRSCCIEINRMIKFINEKKNKDLKYIESPVGRSNVESVSKHTISLRIELAESLLGYFVGTKHEEWVNALTILASDDIFMEFVDKVYKHMKKCYDMAMRMGNRP